MIKTALRYFLINMVALWLTAEILPGLQYDGGVKTILIATVAFVGINILLVPLIKLLFLPLNLLTLGLFAWLINVVALYALTNLVPQIKILPFVFEGMNINGLVVPGADLSVFWVAVLASFMIGLLTHFMHWLST